MNDFLSKPFSTLQLLQKLQQWLIQVNSTPAYYDVDLQEPEPVASDDFEQQIIEQIDQLIAETEKAFSAQDLSASKSSIEQFKQLGDKAGYHKLALLLQDLESAVVKGKYFSAVKQWKPIIDAFEEIRMAHDSIR